ncbi:MAG: hypothetical protein H7A23_12070 [Leptospiraceae bacterium]|nr:hypothetical protein [Leptospiraceae bacterium]
MKKLVVSLLFFFCLNIYGGERNVEWEGSNKLYEPEYTQGIFNKIGIGVFGSYLSLNDNANFKIIQLNPIYGHAKDIYGFNIGLGNGVLNGQYDNGNFRSQKHIGVSLGIFTNNNSREELEFDMIKKPNFYRHIKKYEGNYTIGLSFAGLLNQAENKIGMQFSLGINKAFLDMIGMQAALLSNVAGDATGIQAALLSNVVEKMSGMQAALFINGAEKMSGMQAALFINGAEKMSGMQVALLYNVAEEATGIQIGIFNRVGVRNIAKESNYVQIGLINKTNGKARLQIGLLNFAEKNPIPFFPLINFYL